MKQRVSNKLLQSKASMMLLHAKKLPKLKNYRPKLHATKAILLPAKAKKNYWKKLAS